MERPIYVKEVHLLYLDDLRESGETNMFGAAPYLQREFGMDARVAKDVLTYWMKTFGNEAR